MRGEQVQVLSGHLDHEERGVQQEDGRKATAAARGARRGHGGLLRGPRAADPDLRGWWRGAGHGARPGTAVLVLTNLTTADTSTLACSAENTAGGGRKSIKRRRLTVRPVIPHTGNIHKSSEHFYSLFIKALLLFYN